MLAWWLINWVGQFESRQSGLGWLHNIIHRAVNQGVNFYFRRKHETAISPPKFSLFQYFFLKIKDHTSANILTQKSRFEENYRSEGA